MANKKDKSVNKSKEKKGTIPYPLPIPGLLPGTPQPEVPWPDDIPLPGTPDVPDVEIPTESVPSTTPTGAPADPHKKREKGKVIYAFMN